MTARPRLEVADIFRQYGPAYRIEHAQTLFPEQVRVMLAIERCRTAALGGHVEECDACGQVRIAYNSCGNRHCPKCQNLERARWLDARQQDLLPVEYFHVVFTVPEQIAAIALHNKRVVYTILFAATAETMQRIAADPEHLGAEIGFFAVLHTWGQTLMHHPHLHCVVPGGGLCADGTDWIACRPRFFLPVKVLSKLFRRLFIEKLRRAYDRGELCWHGALAPLAEPSAFAALMAEIRKLAWVVYAKKPFGGPTQVVEYLGRYSHRVAISNNRLVGVHDGKVRFRWKDYRDANQQKVMTLSAEEFIRRFLLHVLPRGFQRLRHFGFFSNRRRGQDLARCRRLLGVADVAVEETERPSGLAARYEAVTGQRLDQCPACGVGRMRAIQVLAPDRHGRRLVVAVTSAPPLDSS